MLIFGSLEVPSYLFIYIIERGDRSVVGAVRPRESQRDCNRASIRRVPRYTYSDVCVAARFIPEHVRVRRQRTNKKHEVRPKIPSGFGCYNHNSDTTENDTSRANVVFMIRTPNFMKVAS